MFITVKLWIITRLRILIRNITLLVSFSALVARVLLFVELMSGFFIIYYFFEAAFFLFCINYILLFILVYLFNMDVAQFINLWEIVVKNGALYILISLKFGFITLLVGGPIHYSFGKSIILPSFLKDFINNCYYIISLQLDLVIKSLCNSFCEFGLKLKVGVESVDSNNIISKPTVGIRSSVISKLINPLNRSINTGKAIAEKAWEVSKTVGLVAVSTATIFTVNAAMKPYEKSIGDMSQSVFGKAKTSVESTAKDITTIKVTTSPISTTVADCPPSPRVDAHSVWEPSRVLFDTSDWIFYYSTDYIILFICVIALLAIFYGLFYYSK